MAERLLLYDTGVLLDIYHGRERVRPYFDRLMGDDADVLLSAVTEAELWRGLRPGEEVAHEALIGRFVILPVGSAAARLAGQWRQRYEGDGLGWMDAFIVATAVVAEATVLTRDKRLAGVLANHAAFELYG